MDNEKIFLQRLSLKSFLLEAYETFTNCRWLFELYLCRRTRCRCLKLRIYKYHVTFLRAIKPWLHVDNIIHIIVNGPMDCLQILENVGDKDVSRIRKLTTSTRFTTTLHSVAAIFDKYPLIHALNLTVTSCGFDMNNAKHITDLLALRKLRELRLTGNFISRNLDNVETENMSTLRIFDVDTIIGVETSETRVNFLKGLKNLSTIGIEYNDINTFAQDSHFFGNLIHATIDFPSNSRSLDKTISLMPALKMLALENAKFEWQTLASACPHLVILRFMQCAITRSYDDSHALCLMTLHLQLISWHPLEWNKSSFIRQMTTSVLQDLYISYIPGYPLRAGNDFMGALRKLGEESRLLTNCTTSIVRLRHRSSISTTFKTARQDRIRVFISRQAQF